MRRRAAESGMYLIAPSTAATTERQVDEEDHAPAGAPEVGVEEHAGDDRAGDGRQAHDRAEHGERLADLVRREGCLDRARPCGIITAPKSPWSTRQPISISGDCARPQSSDAAVNPTAPVRNIVLRPKMSPSRPQVTGRWRTRACTRRGTTAWSRRCRRGRSRIDGAAMLTIVASTRSMTSAARTRKSTIQRFL